MKIDISLRKTVFETSFYHCIKYTATVTSYDVAGGDGFEQFREIVEIKRAADLKPIVDQFAEKAKRAFPEQSFSIHIFPLRGERKVAGFDLLVNNRTDDPLGRFRHVATIERKSAQSEASA